MSCEQEEEEVLIYTILGCASILAVNKIQKRKRKRNVWVKKWLLERRQKGEYDLLLTQLRLEDAESFRRYLRMNTAVFEVNYILIYQTIILYQKNMKTASICSP